ncbi:hypothetical protein CHU98_g6309 [Xylaria longipes]|nr:hypothetical protein CHU98_g6309 [Xylaria longipes]
MDNLGPLPTDFTIAANCASELDDKYLLHTSVDDRNAYYLLRGPLDQTTCYLSGYTANTEQYYSPGRCPTGFTAPCQSTNRAGTVEETVLTCCPTQGNYICQTDINHPWEMTQGCVSKFTATSVELIVSDVSSQVTSRVTATFGDGDAINAYSIQVRYQSTDFISTLSSSSPVISSIAIETHPPTNTPHNTNANVNRAIPGIIVGAIAAFLIAIGAVFLLVRRRYRQRQQQQPQSSPTQQTQYPYAYSYQPNDQEQLQHQYPGPFKVHPDNPQELDAHTRIPELDSELERRQPDRTQSKGGRSWWDLRTTTISRRFVLSRKLNRQAKDGCPQASEVISPRESSDNAGGPQSLGIDILPQPSAIHIVPSVPTVSRPVETETSPTATNGTSRPTPIPIYDPPATKAANSNIWADAYEEFATREPELANDYNTHLATVSGDDTISKTDFLSSSRAKSVVEQLQKNREDKQWHVTFHGKDVKFRTQAEKLAKVLVWCNGIVKDALSAQPYAALAWSGVSILLPLLTSATVQHEAMLSHFDTINHVQIYWKAYEDTFPEEFRSNNGGIVTDLVELYSHILEYQTRIICHLSSAQLSRAWQKVTGWSDWEKKSSDVNRLSEHCKSRMDIAQAKETQLKCDQQLEQMYISREALQQIYEVLEEERKQQQDDRQNQRERELLADLAVDHEGYNNFNPQKVKNTCRWFLEDASFRSWRDSEESSLLWVSAGPGCGKSVLSRSLIDEWQLSTSAATSVVCYFFFKDGDDRRERSANALSAILHQLFIQDCAATPNAGEIVCVLDALDECKEDERNTVIGKLKDFFSYTRQASRHTCRLKFFVTSRPYDTIERSIGSFLNSSCLRIDGDDHSAAVNEDINRVIDAKIPELIPHLSGDNRRRISERLKGMKNRTYLWLRLTFYIIEQSPSDYSRPSDMEALLKTLPDEHSKAYEKILDQKKSKHARILFQLMLAATRPLSIIEANYALTLATAETPFTSHSKAGEGLWEINSFKSKAKNFCGLLVDFHDSNLSFIHQTVREFLTERPEEGGEWNWRGRFKLSGCHYVMSLSCIRYLSLPELDTSAQDTMPDEHIYPFFPYAAEHWPFHYREQDQNTCGNLLEEARNLCSLHAKQAKKWTVVHYELRGWVLTDLTLSAYFGLAPVARAILEEDVNVGADGGHYSVALYLASQRGFPIVVEMLLDTTANVNVSIGLTGAPLWVAIQNNHLAVVRLLLEKQTEQVKVTEDHVNAARDSKHGKEIMALLLNKGGKRVQINKGIMRGVMGRYDYWREILAVILEKEEEIYVDEGAIEAAVSSFNKAEHIALLLEQLLEKRKAQVQVTEAAMVAAAGTNDSNKIMALFLKKLGDQVPVTEAVMVAAAGNMFGGERIIALLLKERGEQIQVTEAVLAAAVGNRFGGKGIIALLKEAGKQDQVRQRVGLLSN